MNIALTDFLTGFSRALDLLTPESGNRGLRRAFIAMTLLRQQGASESVKQRVYVAALLYELGSKRSWGLPDCQKAFSQVSIISDCMPLIFEKNEPHIHCRLLDLVDNFDLLTLNEHHSGQYPGSAIETLCDSIGSRYSLDDILSLRELEYCPDIWEKLASPNLLNDVRAMSPFSSRTLNENDLNQLASFIARIVDLHCLHSVPYSPLVAKYCVKLAQMYGFSQSGIKELRLAGLLHGLGKLALPAGPLMKPGALPTDTMAYLKAYPMTTREILFSIPGMFRTGVIASSPHEQPDGKGLPEGLHGTQLDLSARIISVACEYVSLCVNCNGISTCSMADALSQMQIKAAAGSLDPDVVNALRMVIKYEEVNANKSITLDELLEGKNNVKDYI
ncbi:phosphohydrolase [Enterobacter cloacae subsp. cloacae]|uniref:HD-GYP domain-containing protein n=1 Tax=Enterobacter cloacae TaxID=550 RepID=UPI001C5BC0DC|nr:HD domain-containing phosphohydrolase [Enterobacter cloacae]MBW4203443.1 phosphohydrolase [Enterobacter cloacae subsp. cloacae]MDA2942823.1 phosphohydrolase [Enterobacter cloacae]